MMLSIAVFISMVLAVAESQWEPTRRCKRNPAEPCRTKIDTLDNMDQLLNPMIDTHRCQCRSGQCPNDPYDWEHGNNVIHRSLGRLGNDTRRVEKLMFCNRVSSIYSSLCVQNGSSIVASLRTVGPASSQLWDYYCRCPDREPHQLISTRFASPNNTVNRYTCFAFQPWCQTNQICKDKFEEGIAYHCKCHVHVGFHCRYYGRWIDGVTQRLSGYCQPFDGSMDGVIENASHLVQP